MKGKQILLAVCCIIFLLLGLITATLGPLLSELAENASVPLASMGAVYTALFLGALTMQVVAGPISDRIGQRRVLTGGLILITIGVVGIGFSHSFPLTMFFTFMAGLGHGAVDLGGNVLIATVFHKRSVSALNLLNVFFGLGGFGGPALVSVMMRQWHTGLPVLWLGAPLLALSAVYFMTLRMTPEQEKPALTGKETAPNAFAVYRSLLLWTLSMLILVYVGTENGMGGWLTTYAQNTTGMTIENAALVTSLFWLALTGGRLLSTVLGLRVSSEKLLAGTLIGAVAGGVLLAMGTGNRPLTIVAVILTGMSFGPIFPTVTALVTANFKQEPGKAVGVMTSMGSIGGALLPLLQGLVLDRYGDSASVRLTACLAVLMLVLLLAARMQRNRAATQKLEEARIHD